MSSPETTDSRPVSGVVSARMPSHARIALRRFPYPFRAMLAICSDLDETPDAETYFELMRFLNTRRETAMGTGVGLEVGNTIYFDMAPGHFSYWNASEGGREKLRQFMRSGHIDCIHSFGDLAVTRAHAGRALDELARHDCQLKVWVDHAVAATNLGSDIMHGHGDEPGHAAYHADLTLGYGVEYVWRGRVTSVIGQDRPLSFAGLWSTSRPVASATTIAKEAAKQILARCGSPKYALHAPNETMRPVRLRDGQERPEFIRCNPHHHGVSAGDRGDAVQEVITPQFLDCLAKREGSCILYTHLGKLDQNPSGRTFSPAAVTAFARLARCEQEGQILVATTRRLLDYRHMVRHLEFTVAEERGSRIIRLNQRDTARLSGLTLYTDAPERTRLVLPDGRELPCVNNPPDETGQASISVPWTRLKFPET